MTSRSRAGRKLRGSCRSMSRWVTASFLASGGYPSNCSALRSRGSIRLEELREGPALRERWRESHDRTKRRYKVSRLHGAVINDALTDACAERHHPCCARGSIASAMMLKSISSGVLVGITAEIWKDEERCVACILRLALNSFPDLGAEAI